MSGPAASNLRVVPSSPTATPSSLLSPPRQSAATLYPPPTPSSSLSVSLSATCTPPPPLFPIEDPTTWENLATSFRTRSRAKSHSRSASISTITPKLAGISLSRVVSGVWKKDIQAPNDDGEQGIASAYVAAAASWCGYNRVVRPWSEVPKKKKQDVVIPEEQTEGWVRTREVCLLFFPMCIGWWLTVVSYSA